MSDTNIRISLELADAAAQKALSDFISKSGTADNAFQKLGETGKSTFEEITVGIGKSIGAYEIFEGNLAANVAIEAFNLLSEAAHKLFDTLIVEGIQAAEENQNAINSLNVALAASGHYSAEASKGFQEFADELQKNSIFSHDAVIQNAALIESLAKLDTDGLKRATTAAANLSSALGKDFASTAQAVGKAAEGNVTAIKKMGVAFEIGRTNAETFNNILRSVEESFGGAAESKINTYSGAVSQASNSFKDLTEQIGNVVVKNPAAIQAINELGHIFNELSDALNGQNSSLAKLAGEGLSKFFEVSAIGVTILDTFARTVQVLFGTLEKLALPVVGLTGLFKLFTGGVDEASNFINKMTADASKNFHAMGASGDGALAAIAESLLRLKEASDKGLTALAQGADGTVEPTNRSTKSVAELSQEMKNAEERAKSFALSLVKASEDGKSATTGNLALAKDTMAKDIAIDEELLNRKIINKVEFENRKAVIEKTFAKKSEDEAIQKLAKENELVDFALAHKKISENEYYTAKKELADEFALTSAKNDQLALARDAKLKKDLYTAELQLQQQKVKAAGDTFSNLASLTQTKSRELFEIGKAASIAAALIHTYEAITITMASVPYPFNIPLAIAQGIAGAVQVTNIEQTSPSFEQGGIVPGSSWSGDNVTANVNSGEMILNRAQQKNLFDIAQNGGSGSSRVEALLTRLIQSVENNPVQVSIGGKTIVDTLRSELVSGRKFA